MTRQMVRLGLAAAVLLAGRAVRADTNVSVTRGEGADQCPDGPTLSRLAASSSPRLASPPTHGYRVAFVRTRGLYRAEIVDDTGGRTRVVQDSSSSCGPLAHAAAVILASMWSSEADEASPEPETPSPPSTPPVSSSPPAPPPPSPPSPPPPPPSPWPPPPSPSPPTERDVGEVSSSQSVRPWRPRWVFGAGGGLAGGIVRQAAPAVVVNAGGKLGAMSLSIGGVWIPRQELGLVPGSVRVDLIAGVAKVCGSVFAVTRLGACGGFFAGALSGAAGGYTGDSQATRPWYAASAELFVDGPLPLSVFRYRLGVAGIVPVHTEVFRITGVGVAYDTPAFGGLFTLALEAETL